MKLVRSYLKPLEEKVSELIRGFGVIYEMQL